MLRKRLRGLAARMKDGNNVKGNIKVSVTIYEKNKTLKKTRKRAKRNHMSESEK